MLGTLAVLGVIAFAAIKKNRAASKMNQCHSQLRQIGLATKMWIGDSSFDSPWSKESPGTKSYIGNGQITPHFSVLSNQVGAVRNLTCPGDDRLPAQSWTTLSDSNISYFINLDGGENKYNRVIFGDRLIMSSIAPMNGMLTLSTNATYQWQPQIHNQYGFLSYGDGSIRPFKSEQLEQELQRKENLGSRLQLPR